jgi:hypothetical protein
MKEQRERHKAISRALNKLSSAARFYALQVKNDHSEVLDEALPEMQGLLSACENLSNGNPPPRG